MPFVGSVYSSITPPHNALYLRLTRNWILSFSVRMNDRVVVKVWVDGIKTCFMTLTCVVRVVIRLNLVSTATQFHHELWVWLDALY